MALGLAAVGCIPSQQPTTESSPAVITVVAGEAGVNLNPYTNVLSSRQVGALLFRGLLGVDGAGLPEPDLAVDVPTTENGGISPDGLRITYQLDPDAQWADGEPLTANDVVFTWELLDAGILVDDPRGIDGVRDVTAPDERTVVLTLNTPDAPLAWHFIPYVLPRHLLGDSADVLSDDFWVHPVGSRGRVVERPIKNTQVDLVDPGRSMPAIRVVFADGDAAARRVWESQSAAVWLDPPVGPAGSEKSDSVPGGRWRAFVMNMDPERATADLAVREAFAQVATPTVAPGDAGPYGPPIAEWRIEAQRVQDALSDAGWRPGAGGIRFRGDTELVLDVIFNPITAEEGNRIEYDMVLERFGGRIEPFPSFQYSEYAGASPLGLGEFDVALLEFPVGIPYGWAWPFDSTDVPSEANPYGLNVSRVSDDRLDAAAAAMRDAGTPEALKEAVADGWTRLEELRVVHWDERFEQTVLYKGVEGVRAQPYEEYALRFADEWRLAGAGTSE